VAQIAAELQALNHVRASGFDHLAGAVRSFTPTLGATSDKVAFGPAPLVQSLEDRRRL
jgi:hypothetical protein